MGSYKPEYDQQGYTACRLGAIDDDLAELFDVTTRTIYNWYKKQPSFKEACDAGKDRANDMVKQALFKRATGATTFKEVLSKEGEVVALNTQHPPDTGACMAWLYNRDRANWRRDPSQLDDEDGKKDNNVYNITIVKPDDIDDKTN